MFSFFLSQIVIKEYTVFRFTFFIFLFSKKKVFSQKFFFFPWKAKHFLKFICVFMFKINLFHSVFYVVCLFWILYDHICLALNRQNTFTPSHTHNIRARAEKAWYKHAHTHTYAQNNIIFVLFFLVFFFFIVNTY